MTIKLLTGDCLETLKSLPSESVHMCVTSPPYFGLRRYIEDDSPEKQFEIGLEATPEIWCAAMVAVFREVRRVLRPDGTLWVNVGDSYAGSGKGPSGNLQAEASCIGNHQKRGTTSQMATRSVATAQLGDTRVPGYKPKDLIGIPWMLAFALRADGWYLRSEIIWHKPNPMPESVADRPTKAHEQLFLLSKSRTYYYDADAIREEARYGFSEMSGNFAGSLNGHHGIRTVTPGDGTGGRNKRSVFKSSVQYATLRRDLPPETSARVVAELAKRGLL